LKGNSAQSDEQPFLRLAPECFSFYFSEVESAIVTHKLDDGIELLVYEARIVRDHCDSDNGARFAVLMVNLRNRNVKSAFQPADKAFDDASFILQRSNSLHIQMSG